MKGIYKPPRWLVAGAHDVWECEKAEYVLLGLEEGNWIVLLNYLVVGCSEIKWDLEVPTKQMRGCKCGKGRFQLSIRTKLPYLVQLNIEPGYANCKTAILYFFETWLYEVLGSLA